MQDATEPASEKAKHQAAGAANYSKTQCEQREAEQLISSTVETREKER
jgi:hypothetical protein